MMCPTLPSFGQSSSISALDEEAGVKGGQKKREAECLPFSTAAQSGDLEEDNSPKDYRPPLTPIGAGEAEEGSVQVLLNQHYYRAGCRQGALFTTCTILLIQKQIIFPSVSVILSV